MAVVVCNMRLPLMAAHIYGEPGLSVWMSLRSFNILIKRVLGDIKESRFSVSLGFNFKLQNT